MATANTEREAWRMYRAYLRRRALVIATEADPRAAAINADQAEAMRRELVAYVNAHGLQRLEFVQRGDLQP